VPMKHDADVVKGKILEAIGLQQKLLDDTRVADSVVRAVDAMVDAFARGGRVLFCGNGGSAAEAQHLAAELGGRFLLERDPLDAEALHGNTSFLTAVANDYGYEEVYARLVRAKGRRGDVLVGISTSGNSANIVQALRAARDIGMLTIGMTGAAGGALAALSDVLICIPSRSVPRIQEGHLLLGHVICELVEASCRDRAAKK
jgi:D-sedoheptulose 7-phosphate isomerase